MTRPTEISNEQIIAAGVELQRSNKSITGFALRKLVGGGDAKRLKQVWAEHVASQSVVEAVPVAELPIEVAQQLEQDVAALTQRLSAIVVDINDRAVKASERRVAEVVRTAGEQREQAERETADAMEMVEDLERSVDEKETLIEKLQAKLEQVSGVSQAQAVELAQIKERAAAADQSYKEGIAAAASRETALKDQLEAARRSEQMWREREAQAVGAAENTRVQAEKQDLENKEVCQHLRGELRSAEATITKLETQAEGQAEQHAVAIAEVKTLRASLDDAVRSESEAKGREQALGKQVETLLQREKELSEQLSNSKTGSEKGTRKAGASKGDQANP